ncbi:MAG TPA: hypothetical protein VN947_16545 [Polyangia bacterium]|nr:hypothetical protein [Polyangia bacterium]
MSRPLALVAALVMLVGFAVPARAGNYIIYLQGRGWASWNGETVAASGWTNVTMAFNGNAVINGPETNTTVKNAMASYCSGGNSCIIHCYSAGCLRMLKAAYDLHAGGNSLPGLLYAEGSGSASGGTKLAEVSTQGLTSVIAKLLGQQEKVDKDLTTGAARNTWGYVQNSFGAAFWGFGGYVDICKSLLFFKICGNKYVTGGLNLTADGVVGMDSYSGMSTAGAVTNGCNAAKYSYRYYDSGPYYDQYGNNLTPCTGANRDHYGEPGLGTGIVGADVTGTGYDYHRAWSDSTSQSTCSGTGCDGKFTNTAANYSITPQGQSIATSVAATSSNTTAVDTSTATCWGHCGGTSNGCYCDSTCATYHDCCADKSSACDSKGF